MANIFGQKVCLEFGHPIVQQLSDDEMFHVRKVFIYFDLSFFPHAFQSVASNLKDICAVLGVENTSELILPIFVKLSNDEIWSVRKACAESIVAISRNSLPEKRASLLVEVFDQLVKDSSRWVRSAAFRELGPLIATYEGQGVPDTLLGFYTSMVGDEQDSRFGDSDNVMHAAFNFPAVLVTLGKERWDDVSEVYFSLVKDVQSKVRRSLSFSLHVVAEILGTEMTEKLLLSTFEFYTKDLDDVKVGVLTHYSHFLSVLTAETRIKYLYLLHEGVAKKNNWRFRKLIGDQIGSLASLYPADVVQSEIVPIALELFRDPVVCVRNAVLAKLSLLVHSLKEKEEAEMNLLEALKAFGKESSCPWRLLFGKICSNLYEELEAELFRSHFLPLLLELRNDKVANVRLVCAKTLSGLMKKGNKWYENLVFKGLIFCGSFR